MQYYRATSVRTSGLKMSSFFVRAFPIRCFAKSSSCQPATRSASRSAQWRTSAQDEQLAPAPSLSALRAVSVPLASVLPSSCVYNHISRVLFLSWKAKPFCLAAVLFSFTSLGSAGRVLLPFLLCPAPSHQSTSVPCPQKSLQE